VCVCVCVCVVSMALTCAPVASSWVEKVRVESIWFGHLLQMVANMVDLQHTVDTRVHSIINTFCMYI